MSAGSGLPPGERVQTVLDCEPEKPVPGRVEVHFVDPVPEAIVGTEHGRVLVRHRAPVERVAAEPLAERA